jgi:hypothetical protein
MWGGAAELCMLALTVAMVATGCCEFDPALAEFQVPHLIQSTGSRASRCSEIC